jgi:hypothetical protein
MPHAYNRTAFESGRMNTHSLLSLYCSFVIVELALKDSRFAASAQWDRSHQVLVWITEMQDPVLNSLATQMATALAAIKCTLRDGSEGTISPQLYPSIRYLRHETDFAGTTTETDIQSALTVMQDIEVELKRHGVLQ